MSEQITPRTDEDAEPIEEAPEVEQEEAADTDQAQPVESDQESAL